MSDGEEPAAKMSKLEEMAEGEEMDNGQEEWLSEEILTDDDYNPVADQDQSDSNANTSQEEGNTDSMDQASQDAPNTSGENIERTLRNLETVTPRLQNDLPEELGAFLIRKTVKKEEPVVEQPKKENESELDESVKHSEDDGNDTDDLLRMLGEDNSKKKVESAQRSQGGRMKDAPHSSDDDDDEYIFEGARVTRLRVSKDIRGKENHAKRLRLSKNVLLRKQTASRAEPEDTSDREADDLHSSKVSTVAKFKAVTLESKDGRSRNMVTKAELSDLDEDSVPSSDEAMTMKRMFQMQETKLVTAGARRRGINAVKTVTKRVISIDPKNGPSVAQPTKATSPLKITKFPAKSPVMFSTKTRPSATLTESRGLRDTSIKDEMEGEEHLNDEIHTESEADEESGQRLMRPERMDEEVPSDAESRSDDDSYYDEMPSSESEDANDWFTLDIRAERAADYITMLGEDAKALLTAEQERAAARLGALRRSAGALVTGRRSLAAQLRIARSSLAQLDAALTQ